MSIIPLEKNNGTDIGVVYRYVYFAPKYSKNNVSIRSMRILQNLTIKSLIIKQTEYHLIYAGKESLKNTGCQPLLIT